MRRPVVWSMLFPGETLVPSWRTRSRVLWFAQYDSFLLTRVLEVFAETRLQIHELHRLRRAEVAFFCSNS